MTITSGRFFQNGYAFLLFICMRLERPTVIGQVEAVMYGDGVRTIFGGKLTANGYSHFGWES